MASLTTKELQALEETMDSEKMLVAKYKAMGEATSDTALKGKFDQIASKHQAHFNSLCNYLK